MRAPPGRLLNTPEAARFLRVSEASIRRWSDSGLLPGFRVGRRRERRFNESDLLAFVHRTSSSQGPADGVNIGGVAVPIPTHLATLFSTDAGGLRLTVPFLADGIRLGQPSLLAGTDPILKRYLEALGELEGVDLRRAREAGLFTLVRFDEGTRLAAIAQWERFFAGALAKEQNVIRLVGEMAYVRTMFESEEEMLSFEEAFEVMFKRYPVVAMCQYDVRQFDGAALLRTLKAHPDLFGLRTGTFLN